MSSALVSVVVPAYNALKTLDETLRSVRAQTHQMLDIVVVDDGSADATAALAQRHADADPRVRLIRQANAGVAVARNTGWQAAHSDYIALIDSDDLWAPTLIERLLQAMLAGGPKVGVAYCFFTRIDADSMARQLHYPDPCNGDVLDRILLHNFVGNGSSMMARRAVLLDCGGFDDGLRAAGAQGCDDYLFCCRAAENFHYQCVPEILVGYRDSPVGVSSKVARMLRSWMLVSAQMIARRPDKRELVLLGLRNYVCWLLGGVVSSYRLGQLCRILLLLFRYYPRIGLHVVFVFMPVLLYKVGKQFKRRTMRKIRGRVVPPPPRTRFAIGSVPAIEKTEKTEEKTG